MANKQGARLSSLLIRAGLTVLCLLGIVPAHANNVAVVVGCNGNGLRFADDDARLFAKTLVQFAGYQKADVRVLTSQPQGEEREATAKNISQAIDEMAERQADLPQSSFLFFASAHGVEVTGQGAMLAAKDYDPNSPPTDAQAELTARRLTERFAKLKAGRVIALFDICRKDGLLRSEKEKQNGFVLQQGATGKVATLFSSSEGPSFECDDARKAANGHGYFTFYACRGLSARQSDGDKLPIVGGMDDQAGGVTVRSLHNYIRWNLLDQTKDLPGAGGTRVNRETGAGPIGAAEASASGIGFQLPELKCEAATEQMLLARYAKGSCRPEISPEDRYAVLRDQGLDWYEKGKPERAARYFEDAFGVNREAWAGFMAGVCYHEAGKLKEAEEQYRNAIAADPKYAYAMSNLGILFYVQGKLKEAEEQWRNAIHVAPDVGLTHANLALALYDTNRKEEALMEAKTAQRLGVKKHPVFEKLGLKSP